MLSNGVAGLSDDYHVHLKHRSNAITMEDNYLRSQYLDNNKLGRPRVTKLTSQWLTRVNCIDTKTTCMVLYRSPFRVTLDKDQRMTLTSGTRIAPAVLFFVFSLSLKDSST